MFLAYDKVLFSQYALYEAYSKLDTGLHSSGVAVDILKASAGDEELMNLNEALRKLKMDDGFVPIEYWLFAVRDVTGENFDIYLLDEDSLFVNIAPNVSSFLIKENAKGLLESYRTSLDWTSRMNRVAR